MRKSLFFSSFHRSFFFIEFLPIQLLTCLITIALLLTALPSFGESVTVPVAYGNSYTLTVTGGTAITQSGTIYVCTGNEYNFTVIPHTTGTWTAYASPASGTIAPDGSQTTINVSTITYTPGPDEPANETEFSVEVSVGVVKVEITAVSEVCVADTAQMEAIGTPSGGILKNWKTSEPSVTISATGVLDPTNISDTYTNPSIDVTVDYEYSGLTVTSQPYNVTITRTRLNNWDEYLACRRLVANPAHTPSSNGCTWFPDNPARGAHTSFTLACNAHDICYDTCTTLRDRCDRDFRDDMRATCRAARPLDGPEVFRDCMWWANKIFRFVRESGEPWYLDAQINACVCCD